MPIVVNLDLLLVKRKMSLIELSERMGMHRVGLSEFKNNRAGGVRFTTLAKLCKELNCQPGDILEYVPGPEDQKTENSP